MTRERLQTWALFVLVAVLLIAVVRLYETFVLNRTPHNLEGHVIIDGSATANPPTPPSMQ